MVQESASTRFHPTQSYKMMTTTPTNMEAMNPLFLEGTTDYQVRIAGTLTVHYGHGHSIIRAFPSLPLQLLRQSLGPTPVVMWGMLLQNTRKNNIRCQPWAFPAPAKEACYSPSRMQLPVSHPGYRQYRCLSTPILHVILMMSGLLSMVARIRPMTSQSSSAQNRHRGEGVIL